ncbi:MAG: hypothetical protein BMS9Abin05_0120 [Rhodothermia bacterium]|nr:MAG: hypothetical protein BMS9Abin05_0120 [Rhodothermia bacterium]
MNFPNFISTALFHRTKFSLPILVTSLFLGACRAPDDMSNPQNIVDRALEAHGSDILNNARLTFDFRGRQFSITRQNGMFSYVRSYTDSTGAVIKEILSNDGLVRDVDGVRTEMDSEFYRKMETSVNSVSYFVLLPLPLNDPAVVKTLLGEVEILGEPYYKIDITFQQEGGGRDYQDRFLYWFHRNRFTMDYMAYYFYTDEEGSRFRQATNIRDIGGVRIQDYHNFKFDSLTIETIDQYDELFSQGKLELVSDVNLDNVRLERLDP